jgi:hypothetical protein
MRFVNPLIHVQCCFSQPDAQADEKQEMYLRANMPSYSPNSLFRVEHSSFQNPNSLVMLFCFNLIDPDAKQDMQTFLVP